MRVTDSENDRHSTAAGHPAPQDPLPRLRRRFFGSLVLIGLLVGVMIGRLTTPDPVRLIGVEPFNEGLRLRFSSPAPFRQEYRDGAYALRLQAEGDDRSGALRLNGRIIRWRMQSSERGLILHLVALRPLKVHEIGRALDDGWLLELQVSPAPPDLAPQP